MSTDLKEEFWDRLEDTRAGMLSADGAPSVPMSHYSDDDGGMIWFITAKGTELAKSAATPVKSQYIVCSKDESLYARIDGTLEAVTDPATLDEIWNGIASSWFEGGKDDPDVQLLRFAPSEAEVWATGGGLNFMYEIAKSKVTGEKPDLGMHGTLKLSAA
ncbi:pyridoxamine 5'-phosphate oxidase family protein [Sulfitobacter guttiformis]|uniref:General stress protein 26 n=1 Tax=Sulfitobacter guttiformis TaxID=74349 RepID=A0A420DN78_9RHOB|nr:pyridoxamine 5'-phosphate oxidase family protein [Sulfitobacter guttiformis]KIN73015.1 putative general stress protein 26 [Sulfitobacter guttiformis KCTC 32187]RKE95702.1 general stress protein 26 [Sulfitobacter guttiformis]